MTVTLALAAAVMAACGSWLVQQRRLSRIILGIGLLGNAANLLLLLSGSRGTAPVYGTSDPGGFADPLPQALALTAIVITFGVTMFLLALAFRSWRLVNDDEVEDDVEDRLVAQLNADIDVAEEEQAVRAAEAAEDAETRSGG